MASRSCQRKNVSKKSCNLLDKLLTDGACLELKADAKDAAEELAGLGILTVESREYVRCANPRDGDFRFTSNRNCSGRIYLDESIDQAGEGYQCPSCDRRVYPGSKQRFQALQCHVRPEGVKLWLETTLSKAKYTFKEMEPWFYRVETGTAEIYLCVVDYCEANTKMTREWAIAQDNRAVWMSVNPRGRSERTIPEAWLRCVSLSELLSGDADLPSILKEQSESQRPSASGNAALPIYTKGRCYPQAFEPVVPPHPERVFIIEVRDKEVQVNGQVVVPANATTGNRLFRMLYRQFVEDLTSGTPLEEYGAMNTDALCNALYDETGEEHADPDVVRKSVNRTQAKIEKVIKRETGAAIDRHDIIQTQRWKGIGEGDYGYRLNPYSVVIRPDQSKKPDT